VSIVARSGHGVSVDQAQSELEILTRRLRRD
jgi:hypothetical protein